jgi:UDPglucose 6-dehydrogenase
MIVVDKSTVPVGTADRVRAAIAGELEARGAALTFHVVSNPEFLKEGTAIEDSMSPDRVVIGADDEGVLATMEELYAPFLIKRPRVIAMDVRSAEMTKYAANAMLATKISFMNEMAHICERVGADVNKVRIGIGSDSRIGYSFIYPGCGYGGSCFPKDVRALIRTAAQEGYEPRILRAVEDVNDDQKLVIAAKVIARFGEDLRGRVFAMWGLAFKPGTDDMREAPSIYTVRELTARGARIRAYDPQAVGQAKGIYLKGAEGIEYVRSKYDAADGADAVILMTEWKEFRSPDFAELEKRMRSPVFFDGRNQYGADKMEKAGFEYHQVGVR